MRNVPSERVEAQSQDGVDPINSSLPHSVSMLALSSHKKPCQKKTPQTTKKDNNALFN